MKTKTYTVNPAPHASVPMGNNEINMVQMTYGAATVWANQPKQIVIVIADDWEALYIDGIFFMEDHSVMCASSKQLIEYLGHTVKEIYSDEFHEYVEINGWPKTLNGLYEDTKIEILLPLIQNNSHVK